KETAMALLVLAFAVALGELRRSPPSSAWEPHPRRAIVVTLILLAAASVFVYSLPGLVWFAVAVPIWLALELATGGLRVDASAPRPAVGGRGPPVRARPGPSLDLRGGEAPRRHVPRCGDGGPPRPLPPAPGGAEVGRRRGDNGPPGIWSHRRDRLRHLDLPGV